MADSSLGKSISARRLERQQSRADRRPIELQSARTLQEPPATAAELTSTELGAEIAPTDVFADECCTLLRKVASLSAAAGLFSCPDDIFIAVFTTGGPMSC